jgi:tetratricopeptide (TPR) repeat protein
MTDGEMDEAKRRQALVERGDLEGALASVDTEIALTPSNGLLYRERAHLYLYLGQTQQARSDFDTTARLESEIFRIRPGRLQSNGEHNAIGVTYWMEEHRDLAIAFWRYTTRMLAKNRVSYAHVGGGIESGLLLWFGAVYERNEEDVDLVRQFYEQRLDSKFWSHASTNWPGPIVRFFLNQCDEHALIEGASDQLQALCEAHFALAARARELGRHAAYRKHLKLAAPRKGTQEVYDFYNVHPYFVARFELEKRSR